MHDWRKKYMPGARLHSKNSFRFAVLGITILAYLAASLYLILPERRYAKYAFIGFAGAMLINAIIPHVALSLRYKCYCPGTFSGLFLIIPIHFIIIYNAASYLPLNEIILSTLAVGAALIGCIFTMTFPRIWKNKVGMPECGPDQ